MLAVDSSNAKVLQSTNRGRAATWSYTPKIEVDYGRLQSLCKHCVPATKNAQLSLEAHESFMRAYPSIFRVESSRRPAPQSRSHSCDAAVRKLGVDGDIGAHLASIHERSTRQMEAANMASRLRTMASIVKNIPMKRTEKDIKELAQCLSHFPKFLPSVAYADSLRLAVASRAIGEITHKESCSLPGGGGFYLVLQGKVERISKESSIPSELGPGCTFGEIETDYQPRSADQYQTCGPCVLMRVTSFDYHRATEQCLRNIQNEKTNLVKECPLLKHVSSSVVGKLAEAITWDTQREGQVLVREGDSADRVGFIQEGTCAAYAQVPNTTVKSAQVMVGVLKPYDCISEGLLRGMSSQLYTVVTTSRVRIGWVPLRAIHATEIEKHIPTCNQLTLPMYDKEELRCIYAKRIVTSHWQRIKSTIVSEVVQAKPGR
ncbi:hypothetical protein EMCRGX_G030985 [Ephydatia muelleri]